MHIADDLVRADYRTRREAHADDAARFHQHFFDLRLGADLHPGFAAGFGHGLGDRAHAADRVAPGARNAVHFAEDVVQQDVGRARGVGAAEIADDGVKAQHRLDRIALEPVVQPVPGAAGKEIQKITLALNVELVELQAKGARVKEVRQPAFGVRRGGVQHLAQGGDDGVKPLAVAHIGVGVLGAELGDLRPVGLGAAAGDQIAPVVRGQEVRGLAQDAS